MKRPITIVQLEIGLILRLGLESVLIAPSLPAIMLTKYAINTLLGKH